MNLVLFLAEAALAHLQSASGFSLHSPVGISACLMVLLDAQKTEVTHIAIESTLVLHGICEENYAANDKGVERL